MGRLGEEIDEGDGAQPVARRDEQAGVAAEGRPGRTPPAQTASAPDATRRPTTSAPRPARDGSATTTSAAAGLPAADVGVDDPNPAAEVAQVGLGVGHGAAVALDRDDRADLGADRAGEQADAGSTGRRAGCDAPGGRRARRATTSTSAAAPSGLAWKNDGAEIASAGPRRRRGSPCGLAHLFRRPSRPSGTVDALQSRGERPRAAPPSRRRAHHHLQRAPRRSGAVRRSPRATRGWADEAAVDGDGSWLAARRKAKRPPATGHAHRRAIALGGELGAEPHLGRSANFPMRRMRVGDDRGLQLRLHHRVDVLPTASATARLDVRAGRLDATGAGLTTRARRALGEAGSLVDEPSVDPVARERAGDEHDAPVVGAVATPSPPPAMPCTSRSRSSIAPHDRRADATHVRIEIAPVCPAGRLRPSRRGVRRARGGRRGPHPVGRHGRPVRPQPHLRPRRDRGLPARTAACRSRPT